VIRCGIKIYSGGSSKKYAFLLCTEFAGSIEEIETRGCRVTPRRLEIAEDNNVEPSTIIILFTTFKIVDYVNNTGNNL